MVEFRRRMLDALEAFQAGETAIGTGDKAIPRSVCSFQAMVPKDTDWKQYAAHPVWDEPLKSSLRRTRAELSGSGLMEKLRLGVAGLGRAFSLMLPTFLADTRVQLAGACDPRADGACAVRSGLRRAGLRRHRTLARMPDIDAIYIASPHQFHAAHTRIAAWHGKHVLVEKPMALSLAECDDMIDACREANVHLIVGHCHSFDTPYLRTRELIASGAFGDVKMIQALNYTDYLYRPRRPEELKTEEGGGAVFSQAAHQVDIVRMLAGSRATRIRAAVGNWDPARPTEGAYTATLWFENGAFATLSYNGYAHFDSDEWTGWIGEMGQTRSADDYGVARRKLSDVASPR